MKTKYFLPIVAAVFLLAACTNKEADQQAPELLSEEIIGQELILTAETGDEPGTRTARQSDGSVWWTPGDALSVFYGSGSGGGSRFVSQNSTSSQTATFKGTIEAITGGDDIPDEAIYFWGLYPYYAEASCDGSSITTSVKSTQIAKAGTFSTETFPSLGRSLGLKMPFYNICGGIKFSVLKEGIKKVTITGANHEKIAGKIKVVIGDDARPVVSEVLEGEESIVLKAFSGETLATGTDYYFVLVPTVFENGFTITFETATERATRTVTSRVSIKRAVFGTLMEADKNLAWESFVEPVDPDAPIVFADEKVKSKLVAAFDTDQDGELSYAEAAAVTSISGVFGAIKTYTSFDEFQYFTGVTQVPSSMFADWNLLHSITLPEGLKSIGTNAFSSCVALTSITLPEGLTSIGTNAFSSCIALTSITIPDGVIYINDGAFYNCSSLESISIPESVKRLGPNNIDYASSNTKGVFEECVSLSNVTINSSLLGYLPDRLFYNCSKLTNVLIPESLTDIRNYAFYGCNALTSFTVPESDTSISIWSYAFFGCSSLESVTIKAPVSSIGSYAFSGCSHMTSISLPSYVRGIASYAFYNCSALTSISLSESLSSIGAYAFYGCSSLTGNITIPGSVKTISDYVFFGCSGLTDISIPESVKSIGNSAFSNCSGLTSIVIPESVSSIGTYAFSYCTGLTSIVIPESVTTLNGGAFSGCTGLTSISIPESLTLLSGDLFSGCTGLTSVDIPSSVQYIYGGAFSGCTGLTRITIPASVTSIGNKAFFGCTGLMEVIIDSMVPPQGGTQMFDNSTCPIYVPAPVVEDYKTAANWSAYADRIQANPRLIFYSSTDGSVVNPAVVDIAWGATLISNKYVDGQGVISFDGAVTAVPAAAFINCTRLESITIPDSVTSIGTYAFSGCTGLTGIEIPELVTSIDNSVFSGCIGLTNVKFPSSLTSIGQSAFYGCTGLTSVKFPSSLTSIGQSAFYDCTGMSTLAIPASVTSIGSSAFSGCTGLTSIFVYAVNPPVGGAGMFDGSTCLMYVPIASVDLYKSAPYWSSYSDRFDMGVSINTAEEFIAWLASGTMSATLEADITLPADYIPGDLKADFDGKNHTITYNLIAKDTQATWKPGLFSSVDARVSNLKVAGSILTAVSQVGGIAASATGISVFENCESNVAITGDSKVTYNMGGILGNAPDGIIIKNCKNLGKLKAYIADLGVGNVARIGGILGRGAVNVYIENCTNDGELIYSASGAPNVGGIVGSLYTPDGASIIGCSNNGDILVESNASGIIRAGGFVGLLSAGGATSNYFTNCKNFGSIIIDKGNSSTRAYVGGTIGQVSAGNSDWFAVEATDCLNSGSITVTMSNNATNYIGGIIGYFSQRNSYVKYLRCTNTASLSAPYANAVIGGIFGNNCPPESVFTDCTIGNEVKITTASAGTIGLLIGSGVADSPLNSALTGVIHGGQIVRGTDTINITAQNYKDYLVGDYFTGSTDGVIFE